MQPVAESFDWIDSFQAISTRAKQIPGVVLGTLESVDIKDNKDLPIN